MDRMTSSSRMSIQILTTFVAIYYATMMVYCNTSLSVSPIYYFFTKWQINSKSRYCHINTLLQISVQHQIIKEKRGEGRLKIDSWL